MDNTTNDLAANGDVAGEWALLVNELAVDGSLWGLESETTALDVAGSLAGATRQEAALARKHVRLLLESFLSLQASIASARPRGEMSKN